MPLLLSCALLLLTCYWAGLGAVVALDERLARRMRCVIVPCFHPLDAWQCSNGDVVFTDNLARNDVIRRLSLPCGRCVGCRLERSRQWAVRCMHEASMHMFNSFVTLTYDDHLPEYNSLNYKHFQDFMKRLRKSHNGVLFISVFLLYSSNFNSYSF